MDQILSGQSRELIVENIHDKLTEVSESVHNGTIPVELYQISKVRFYTTQRHIYYIHVYISGM